jgi:hypothetical protein
MFMANIKQKQEIKCNMIHNKQVVIVEFVDPNDSTGRANLFIYEVCLS